MEQWRRQRAEDNPHNGDATKERKEVGPPTRPLTC